MTVKDVSFAKGTQSVTSDASESSDMWLQHLTLSPWGHFA